MGRILRISALAASVLAGAAQAYAQNATLVMQSGEHVQGQVVNIGSNVVVRVNGRQTSIPAEDVAIVDFVSEGRDIPEDEFLSADDAGYDGLIVLRNGRTFVGRPVTTRANQLVYSDGNRRQTIPVGRVARIYLGSGLGDAGGYSRFSQDDYSINRDRRSSRWSRGAMARDGAGFSQRSLRIPTDQMWTETGIYVSRGQRVHISSNGRVQLSTNSADVGSPAGADNGRIAPNAAMPTMPAGALIGRIEGGPAFAIGADRTITMPASGRLFLGVNDDYVDDNSGEFEVDIARE